MHLDPDESMIILNVEIFKGQTSRVLRMALDTGATFVMIPPKIVAYLGYSMPKQSKRIRMTTPNGLITVPCLTLDGVKVLGNMKENIEAVCHELPPKSRVDGLLGLSFLKHFDTDLHYLKRTLKIRS